jgi:ubiquinone biosynthesis protein COQ4
MAKHVRVSQLPNLTASLLRPSPAMQSFRCFSVLNRPPPNYEGHIPLTVAERLGLAVGSGLGSFLDPRRGGMFPSRMFLPESID